MSNVPPAVRHGHAPRGREPVYNQHCWLARHGVWEGPGRMPSCDGRLVKAHLIRQQTLLKELPAEVVEAGVAWVDAVWVWACGGIMGNTGHHGHFDSSKKIRVPRGVIPAVTEAFARKWELEWWLDISYGPMDGEYEARS